MSQLTADMLKPLSPPNHQRFPPVYTSTHHICICKFSLDS